MTPHVAAWLFPAWVGTLLLFGAIGAGIAWPVAFDRGFEEACGSKRHRHRVGGPQETALLELPRAGRLPLEPEPEPEWTFFGAQVEPQPGAAEYELMTRTPGEPADPFGPDAWKSHHPGCACPDCRADRDEPDETPSAWTRRQGEQLARDIDEMIAESERRRQELVEESNYFQHAMLGDRLTPRDGHEGGAR